MATRRVKPTILLLSLVIISASLASQSPSSKWAPRFLGRFSQPPNQQQQQYRYETKYFSQRLDHFSFSEFPNFPQRYLINTESWVGSERLGPIFFYGGDEGDIEWFAENTGEPFSA